VNFGQTDLSNAVEGRTVLNNGSHRKSNPSRAATRPRVTLLGHMILTHSLLEKFSALIDRCIPSFRSACGTSAQVFIIILIRLIEVYNLLNLFAHEPGHSRRPSAGKQRSQRIVSTKEICRGSETILQSSRHEIVDTVGPVGVRRNDVLTTFLSK